MSENVDFKYNYTMPRIPRRTQKVLLMLVIALIGAFTSTQVVPDKTASVSTSTNISSNEWYPVTKVIDGDTIDVDVAGSIVRVRLIGLDTPEVVDPRKPVQCFGKEASNELKNILTGQSVRLETDPSQSTYDKYGRLLAYVFAPANVTREGILVNKYMIAEGYGHEYTYNAPYKYQKEFNAAEAAARNTQKGLWAPGRCNK